MAPPILNHCRPAAELPGFFLLQAALVWCAALPFSAALTFSVAYGQQGEFVRHSVELQRELGDLYPFDLSGDGRRELVVVELDRTNRDPVPYLTVYRAAGKGFEKISGASSALPGELSMAGVGRFSFGPGLVLLSPGRLEIRPWEGGTFSQARARSLEVESMFVKGGGELKTGMEWIVDLNGDGYHEIVVPRLDGLGVVRLLPGGEPYLHAFLRIRAKSRFLFYFRGNYVAYRLPTLGFFETGGAGWKDVVAFHDGLLQVFRLGESARGTVEPELQFDLQPPRPFDPKEPWDPPLKLVRAEDLNADGLLDLVFIKVGASDASLNAQTRVLIYYGRPGPEGAGFRLPAGPAPVFASEGFSHPILVDMNGNGRTDLALGNVEIGFWNAIKALITRTVSAEAAFYLMPEVGRYPDEPDEVVDYSVKFALGKFAHRPITAFGDLNGDQRPDLLLSSGKGSLGIHWGLAGSFWESGHDVLLEDFLPTKSQRLRVVDVDGDGRDDLIFLYNRNDIRLMPEVNHKFTVLLSRFRKPEKDALAGSP